MWVSRLLFVLLDDAVEGVVGRSFFLSGDMNAEFLEDFR